MTEEPESLAPQSHTVHIPVMLREIMEALDPQPGQIIVDGTLGGGGHTRALAERVGKDGLVISLDRDPGAIERAEKALHGLPIILAHSNFSELQAGLDEIKCGKVDGMMLDLGLSSDQLADRERGFSFNSDGPLDLRFNPDEGKPAYHLVNTMKETNLADLIFEYGEERFSRRIARKICEVRRDHPIRTASELAEIVRRCVPRSPKETIDRATRTFQALRIAVNGELQALEKILREIPYCVKPGGKVAILSFHSLEDRLVKDAFREKNCYRTVNKKPILADTEEIARNPRSRSAKLRIAEIVEE
ncbi:MAG: 16S rRNA (cytosine(1402)-N(4))-methyltransferase RsmH [Thermoguttaceae bacterium]|nr:16S rRNA (cytosine(1402)-N(4))-methyltransferase RsmH [Thermoguttaceae bacterium]